MTDAANKATEQKPWISESQCTKVQKKDEAISRSTNRMSAHVKKVQVDGEIVKVSKQDFLDSSVLDLS